MIVGYYCTVQCECCVTSADFGWPSPPHRHQSAYTDPLSLSLISLKCGYHLLDVVTWTINTTECCPHDTSSGLTRQRQRQGQGDDDDDEGRGSFLRQLPCPALSHSILTFTCTRTMIHSAAVAAYLIKAERTWNIR